MTSIASMIRAMAAVGASPEAIAIAVEALEDAARIDGERKAKQAERTRKCRAQKEANVSVTLLKRDGNDDVTDEALPLKEFPLEPPKKLTPTQVVISRREAAFEQFWAACPHKVGKAAARKAFDRVGDKRLATLPELLDGMSRYRRLKPDDRPWCNPSTWLSEERWRDEPAEPVKSANGARYGPAKSPQRSVSMFDASMELLAEFHDKRH